MCSEKGACGSSGILCDVAGRCCMKSQEAKGKSGEGAVYSQGRL